MTLPFLRQYPNRRALTELAGLSVVVENIGKEFIAKGGVYLIEIMTDGRVHVAACIEEAGKQQDIIEVFTANGPDMLKDITRLVVASVKHVKGRKAIKPQVEVVH